MDRYFIEFEFEQTLGSLYWFPLTTLAENFEMAHKVAQAFRKGIEDHHKLPHSGGPVKLDDVPRSALLRGYIAARFRGKAVAMEVLEYNIRGVEPDVDLSIDDNLQLAAAEAEDSFDSTIASIRHSRLLVRLIRPNNVGRADEFLVINIISPQR